MSIEQQSAYYGTNTSGYEVWTDSRPSRTVQVHQLVAVANGADPHKVFSGGEYHTHHKNGLSWDNRPENIELLTAREHGIEHSERELERRGLKDSLSKSSLKKLYWDEGKSYQEIGDKIGVDSTTVENRIRDYGLAWDQKGPNA